MFAPLFSIALLVSMALPAWLKPPQSVHRSHAKAEIAQRQSLEFTNATWYVNNVGLGACGRFNFDSDFVVALNVEQYGFSYLGAPSPKCFKQITMTYNGRSAVATIVDECISCRGYKDLDLSPGLFEFFAPLSEDIIYGGTWSYNN